MQKKWLSFAHYLKLLIPYWDKSLVSFLAVGIWVLFSLVPPLITKVLLDYVYPNKDLKILTILVLLGVGIFFFKTFFADVSEYLDAFIHQTLEIDLRKKFFTKLLRLPLGFFYDKKTGDLVVRITNDIEAIVDVTAEIIPMLVKTVLQLVFILSICFMIDKNLTCLALLGVPLYFIQTHFFAGLFENVRRRTQDLTADVYDFYQEKMSNIRTIKSFNQEIYESEHLVDKLKRVFALTRERLFIGLFNSFLDGFLIIVWSSFLAWYAGYRVITGHVTVGEIMALLVYLGQIHQPFMDFGAVYKNFAACFVSVERVNDVLNAQTEVYQDVKTYVLYEIEGRISFENVSFCYPDSREYILKNIQFVSEPGKMTAICGASGAGKSTMVDLLLRFISPTGGEIYIDKHNFKEVSLVALRANISIISQEVVIFSGTVRENLQYGCAHPAEEKMMEAASLAEIHDFIMTLPQGYETKIGKGGMGLSGGQLQRLSIARALLRDVKILVMDEATSALDSISEAKIYNNIKNYISHKTVLLISHRISTLKNADKIYVISGSEVVESGPFDELVNQKGEFYKFYQASSRGEVYV